MGIAELQKKNVLRRIYEAYAVIKDKFIHNSKHRSSVDPKLSCVRFLDITIFALDGDDPFFCQSYIFHKILHNKEDNSELKKTS